MQIQIIVKTNARRDEVLEIQPGIFRVSVIAPPHDGEANAAIVEILAKHFRVSKSKVTIRRGQKSKTKVVEILTNSG